MPVKDNLKRVMVSFDDETMKTLDDFCFRFQCSYSVALSICLEYSYYVKFCAMDYPLDLSRFIELFFDNIHGHHFVRIKYDKFGNRIK